MPIQRRKKKCALCTSLYQLLYCCNRRGVQNIDCSSQCQIKNVSKQKPLFFCFVFIFLRQFFVRSKTNFVMFSLFLYENYVYFKNHVVMNLLRLLTHRSKQFSHPTISSKSLTGKFFRMKCAPLIFAPFAFSFLASAYLNFKLKNSILFLRSTSIF